MADQSGAVDLGTSKPTPEQEEQLRKMAEEHGEGASTMRVITAFVVALSDTGEVFVTEYDGEKFDIEVEPTNDLIYGLAGTVQKDLIAQESATTTLSLQMQQARAMQQQIEQQRMAQNLGDLRGGARG